MFPALKKIIILISVGSNEYTYGQSSLKIFLALSGSTQVLGNKHWICNLRLPFACPKCPGLHTTSSQPKKLITIMIFAHCCIQVHPEAQKIQPASVSWLWHVYQNFQLAMEGCNPVCPKKTCISVLIKSLKPSSFLKDIIHSFRCERLGPIYILTTLIAVSGIK